MSVSDSHNKAMELAERALMARMQGDTEESTKLFEKALEDELEAIRKLETEGRIEPTYSVLHRSAGTLALDCNQFQKAEEIIKKALSQNPPQEIAEELHELWSQIPISPFLNNYRTDINIWYSSNFRVPSLAPRKELENQGSLTFGEALGLGASRFPLMPPDVGFEIASKEPPTTSSGKNYELRFYDSATSYYNYTVESITAIEHEVETSENQVDRFDRLFQSQSTELLPVGKGGQQQPTRLLGVGIS